MSKQKLKLDFHMHSTASDGSYLPSELIKKGEEENLTHMALTDHDTIDGIESFLAQSTDIECIRGIELSTEYPIGELHIVGLFIDIYDDFLQMTINEVKSYREDRNENLIKNVSRILKRDITTEELLPENALQLGRPHMAAYLVRNGFANSISDAFDKYLSNGAIADIPKKRITFQQAIDSIKSAGGVAVLAHPSSLLLTEQELDQAVKRFTDDGLDAIEVYSSHSNNKDIPIYLKIAERYNLAISGGSDFHGSNSTVASVGVNFGDIDPKKILNELMIRC